LVIASAFTRTAHSATEPIRTRCLVTRASNCRAAQEVVEILTPEPSPDPGPSVDTAALLRELASLGGFNDDSGDSHQTSTPVKSGGAKEQPKKKKGLFGR
jgi:hypothetical protein